MAITHTWTVDPNLQTRDQDGETDVVYSVVWRLHSEETVGSGDDAITYEISSANQISIDTSDLSNFTALSSLTEVDVVGWAKAKIDANALEGSGVDCDEWEAGHERNISKQKIPSMQVKIAPWMITTEE